MIKSNPLTAFAFWAGLLCARALFGGSSERPVDLTQLSIEELMQIEVTSVSKKEERLFESAAAVFILTQEDLQRSGARTIQDALRLVPGMNVGRIDANKWAISVRGFNQTFSNKLLVMIDGRSVYSRIFSGVFWETQDIMLEDVERIEVIRGPGATLWGANAVNGVINIITRHTDQTQGGLLHAGYGSHETGPFGMRYGGRFGGNGFYRLYSQVFQRDASQLQSGEPGSDDWWMVKNGFRADYRISSRDAAMVSGEMYWGTVGQTIKTEFLYPSYGRRTTHDLDVIGGHLLGRWNHRVSPVSDFTLKLFYSHIGRDDSLMIGGNFQNIDLDFEYRWAPNLRHSIIWGGGIRFTSDRFDNTELVHFTPPSRNYNLYGIYIQDDVNLMDSRLFVTLGSKFERDDLAGTEFQPNIRLRWLPSRHMTMWGAISRAVRTPARSDQSFSMTRHLMSVGDDVYFLQMLGTPNLPSESLLSHELGFRLHPTSWLFFDCTGFCHDYAHLRTYALGPVHAAASDSGTVYTVPYVAGDDMAGRSCGFESFIEYQASRVRLRGTYAFFRLWLDPEEHIENMRAEDMEGEAPRHQWTLQTFVDLPFNLELDGTLRYVDGLPAIPVDAYLTADVRAGWSPSPNWEWSIMGRNLLQKNHMEFKESHIPFYATAVQRQILGRLLVRF